MEQGVVGYISEKKEFLGSLVWVGPVSTEKKYKIVKGTDYRQRWQKIV